MHVISIGFMVAPDFLMLKECGQISYKLLNGHLIQHKPGRLH